MTTQTVPRIGDIVGIKRDGEIRTGTCVYWSPSSGMVRLLFRGDLARDASVTDCTAIPRGALDDIKKKLNEYILVTTFDPPLFGRYNLEELKHLVIQREPVLKTPLPADERLVAKAEEILEWATGLDASSDEWFTLYGALFG